MEVFVACRDRLGGTARTHRRRQSSPIERDLAADQRDLAEEALRRAALASARRLNVVVTPGRREGRQWRPLDESDSDDDSDDDL